MAECEGNLGDAHIERRSGELRVRGLALAVVLGWLACLSGCMTVSTVEPFDPVALGPNEGILVVQVDTDVPIDRLALNGRGIDFAFTPGRHVRLLKVSAGECRFTHLTQGLAHWHLWGDVDLPKFRVVAGTINYPGVLYVRKVSFGYLYIRQFSRAGQVLRALEARYPRWLERYDVVEARDLRDDFLSAYQSLPDAARAASDAAAGE